jgi:tRNA pseudouridine55 synthase
MATGDGLLVVDKPAGWTSHDVVARVRRLAGTRRVGHAGTLDPMATGVLVLGVGRGTRLITYLVGCDKAYSATIRLGQSTTTDDAEGEVAGSAGAAGLTRARIEAAVLRLTGPMTQVPPAFSAIKVAGRRSYAAARAGEQVDLPARPVVVSRFEIEDVAAETVGTGEASLPVVDVDVRVEVSSGTYVRALARDLGADLGVGGHVTRLRRTRVGGFGLEGALDLTAVEPGTAAEPLALLDLADAARAQFVTRELSAAEAGDLAHGRPIASSPGRPSGPVAAIGPDGRLVAMLAQSGPHARARVVFAPAGS